MIVRLTFTAAGDRAEIIQRIRKLLKFAWRQSNLKCLEIQEIQEDMKLDLPGDGQPAPAPGMAGPSQGGQRAGRRRAVSVHGLAEKK
jgi:hypothetical protein